MVENSDVRVLVVDDLADSAETLARLLETSGYVARTADDGASALAVAEEFRPHCVLLDVNMPGMDGLELTRRLRDRYCDDIVLVAVTGGDAADAKVSRTFELVDHYIGKPIDLGQLAKILPALTR